MDKSTQQNLERLRSFHLEPYDQQRIDNAEAALKLAELGKKVRQNPFFTALVDNFSKRITEINSLLTTDRTLDELGRIRLFERRDAYEYFVNLLDGVSGRASAITQEIASFVARLSE